MIDGFDEQRASRARTSRGRHIARQGDSRSPGLPGRPGQRRRVDGDGVVARGHRLRADPWASPRVRQVGSWPDRLRSSRPWLVPRAPRPGRLHGRLPARLAARRRQGIPDGRGSRGQGAGRADRPLPGRELRVGLQLARRRGPEGAASDGAGSRMEHARIEPVRDQRVHRLVRAGRHGAVARHELRHGQRRVRAGLRRVLQPSARHPLERPAARPRLRAAARRQVLVPRQRDGRPLADRAAPGARVRAQGA